MDPLSDPKSNFRVPHAEAADEGIFIVAQPRIQRQFRQPLGVSASKYNLIGT
jgi:hypothetical protein